MSRSLPWAARRRVCNRCGAGCRAGRGPARSPTPPPHTWPCWLAAAALGQRGTPASCAASPHRWLAGVWRALGLERGGALRQAATGCRTPVCSHLRNNWTDRWSGMVRRRGARTAAWRATTRSRLPPWRLCAPFFSPQPLISHPLARRHSSAALDRGLRCAEGGSRARGRRRPPPPTARAERRSAALPQPVGNRGRGAGAGRLAGRRW